MAWADPIPGRDLRQRVRRLGLGRLDVDIGHTNGNRFLLVWHRQAPDPTSPVYWRVFRDLAAGICRLGPDLDDTLHLVPGADEAFPDFSVIGGDGRRATHCGNGLIYAGARLFARAGLRRARLRCGHRTAVVAVVPGGVEVDLGRAIRLAGLPVRLAGLYRPPVVVDTGEPHAVSFAEDVVGWRTHLEAPLLEVIGTGICQRFGSRGINWTWAAPTPGAIDVRTFERGVRRFTTSCGTGAAAAVYAALLAKRLHTQPVTVRSEGGLHSVAMRGDAILLTGTSVHLHSTTLGAFLQGDAPGAARVSTPADLALACV